MTLSRRSFFRGLIATTAVVALAPLFHNYVVNVRDYGAKGDSMTDDSAAFQAAFNAVVEGGRVIIPAGTYRIGREPIYGRGLFTIGA